MFRCDTPATVRKLPANPKPRMAWASERSKAQVRAHVKHPLDVVTNPFRHRNARCRRLAKNTALANLMLPAPLPHPPEREGGVIASLEHWIIREMPEEKTETGLSQSRNFDLGDNRAPKDGSD